MVRIIMIGVALALILAFSATAFAQQPNLITPSMRRRMLRTWLR
jgi:hypothetical protein